MTGPYDTRDAQAHADVAAVFEELRADHPAREAYTAGAGTLELAHLIADRAEWIERLKDAFRAGDRRTLKGSNGIRP